jgi:DNA-binding NarL/FixJ family response regulator
MKSETITIGIADDQSLFRKGLISLINSFSGVKTTLEASNGNDLLTQLSLNPLLPEVLLLDLKMPELDGIETTKEIRKQYPNIKIIILSIYNEERFILHLLECGAHAYLFKDVEPIELERAIRSVSNEGFYFTDKILEVLQNQQNKRKTILNFDYSQNNISKRELEVLELICAEFTTEEISEKLFISPRTVEGHRNNLLVKTGAKNIAGLVVFAFKNGIVQIKP